MLLCLRCSAPSREEESHAGCPDCGEGVFIKSKQHTLAARLASTSVADKEALLDALEDALGEETDRDCVIVVDADSITMDEGAYHATVAVRDAESSRTSTLDEEPALAFLTKL